MPDSAYRGVTEPHPSNVKMMTTRKHCELHNMATSSNVVYSDKTIIILDNDQSKKNINMKCLDEIRKFNEERDWDQFHTPENLAKSISIEAGELLECFQWDNNFNKEEVCEELADVTSYCIMLADRLGVDLEEIVLDKLEKTRKKYPIEKARGVSTKYDKL